MDYREVFNRGLHLCPDREVLIDGNRRFTWKQWVERHQRLANALLGLGLKKGDRLGLLLKNRAECFDAYAAGAKTGIVIVPINFRLNPDSIVGILAQAQCRALLVETEFLSIVRDRHSRLPRLQHLIVVDAREGEQTPYEHLLASALATEPMIDHSDDDLAVVIYTTGTTGDPKGAMATRRIMLTRMLIIAIEMELGQEDRYLNAMPIFHIGIVQSLAVVWRGGTNIVLREFSPDAFCVLAAHSRATKTFLTPAVINMVLNSPLFDAQELGNFRLILYGAAPMPLETLRHLARMLPGCELLQAYGTSECYALVYLSPAEHRAALAGSAGAERKLGSIGRKSILAQVKVVDEDGEPVAPGAVGEILLRSSAIMSGYLGRPEDTAESIRDGWFCTRDLATVDEYGYVFLVDRKSHMIITGGENVYPAQVENVLHDHPGVTEAAVIGVPDDTWGESVKALIVPKPDACLTEVEIIAFCAQRMASYAKPKSIEFVTELPHTATGKLDKLSLKKKYWDRA